MIENVIDQKTNCHHCGDECDEKIVSNHHFFCCYGCKAVYELLSEVNLDHHFFETSKSNTSWSPLKSKRKYAFLDNEELKPQLLKYLGDDISMIKFFLPGIHCSSCIFLLEHLPRLNNGISRSVVNYLKKEVTISFHYRKTSLQELAILLAQLGYPPEVSLNNLDETKKHVSRSNLGIKIAVAGFCFGNSMLMSMPEYLDKQSLLTKDFESLFNWINLMLALPVLLFSGRDYFIKATKSLFNRRLSIEVPIALGVIALFGRSAFEIISQTGSGYVDSLSGLIFFLLIGKWYQSKTYEALSFDRDYTSYFPISINCLIDGKECVRTLKELKAKDIVVIHNDELIPADGIIKNGKANIDYSFVTGESDLISKSQGETVYAGGRQKGQELHIELTKDVQNSDLTQLWNADSFKKKPEDLSLLIDKVGQYFTLVIILIAIFAGGYWWVMDSNLTWMVVTSILIVACPCALALTLPFAYGHAMRTFGKVGFYLKNASVIESLASIRRIVFDKTGTLTANHSNISFHGATLPPFQGQILKSALGNSAHPLSKIIHRELPVCDKISLTSFREDTGLGFTAEIEGKHVIVGSADYLGVQKVKRKSSISQVYVMIDQYLGYFEIPNTYREGVFDMLQKLSPRYTLELLSGDNDREKSNLQPYFDHLSFNQKPQDKLDHLKKLDTDTLMIGDGLNDAGALRTAKVGIALSEDIHQFSPSCDAILHADNFLRTPEILRFSKSVRSIVFIGFGISFLYNIVGLSFAISGHLTPLVSAILMPISSVSVVGFITLSVNFMGRQFFRQL